MSKTSVPDDKPRRRRGRPAGSWSAESAREKLADAGVHVHDFDRKKEHRTRKPTTRDPEADGWGLSRKGPGYALQNPKYEEAAWHIAGGLPPTQAFRLAGFAAGTATNYAREIETLEHPAFAERVEELREAYNKRGGRLSIDYVLDRQIALATSNIADYIELDPKDGWRVKDLTKLPPALQECVSRVWIDRDGRLNFTLHDKVKVLESVARTLTGSDKVSVGIDVALGERLDTALKRVRTIDARPSAPAPLLPPIDKSKLPTRI
jgi:hypothetical protein